MINEIKTKDLGETGELIWQVVFELSSSSDIENKGVFGFIKEELVEQNKIWCSRKNIDNIVEKLSEHQMFLRKDCSTL